MKTYRDLVGDAKQVIPEVSVEEVRTRINGGDVPTLVDVRALSREAGAWAELHETALEVNPFDIASTAETLARALTMGRAERSKRSAAIRRVAAQRTPRDWLDDQLAAAKA